MQHHLHPSRPCCLAGRPQELERPPARLLHRRRFLGLRRPRRLRRGEDHGLGAVRQGEGRRHKVEKRREGGGRRQEIEKWWGGRRQDVEITRNTAGKK